MFIEDIMCRYEDVSRSSQGATPASFAAWAMIDSTSKRDRSHMIFDLYIFWIASMRHSGFQGARILTCVKNAEKGATQTVIGASQFAVQEILLHVATSLLCDFFRVWHVHVCTISGRAFCRGGGFLKGNVCEVHCVCLRGSMAEGSAS